VSYDCNACHAKPNSTSFNHSRGFIGFSSNLRGDKYSRSSGDKVAVSNAARLPGSADFGTCNNTTCHGQGSPRWSQVTGVAECDVVDAIIMMSVLGIPTSAGGDREIGAHGEYVTLSAWEDSLMALIADLMERTGKPIINVPDLPIRGSVFDYGRRYRPIVLSSARAAALALDRMEWYASYRCAHNPLA
jgi:predicted CxxxxCH...CXXCH cytochrome family protein